MPPLGVPIPDTPPQPIVFHWRGRTTMNWAGHTRQPAAPPTTWLVSSNRPCTIHTQLKGQCLEILQVLFWRRKQTLSFCQTSSEIKIKFSSSFWSQTCLFVKISKFQRTENMGSKLPQMERVSKILRKITCHSHVATVVHIVDGSLLLAGFFENLEECSLIIKLP